MSGRTFKVVEPILAGNPEICISTQVLNEFSNVFLKKFSMSTKKISEAIIDICDAFTLVTIDKTTTLLALDITAQLKYSYYDSLIIATALQNHCVTLFSEDMHHQHMIHQTLTIINPFKD